MKVMWFLNRTEKTETKAPLSKRSRSERKDFSYFMQLFNNETNELVGHLADISSGGFKIDSMDSIPPDTDFQFRLDLTREMANKPSMVFEARSKWCKVDPLDPFCFNVGFQLTGISPEDLEIFNRMIDTYGTKHEQKLIDLRRTNMW